MTKPIFINKDAEYLFNLGDTFLADEDDADSFATGIALQRIAGKLQRLDDKVLNLLSKTSTDYAKGRKDALQEVYNRSNLPPADRTPTNEMRKVGVIAYDETKVRKIPRGVSGLEPGKSGSKFNGQPKARADRLAGLSLKLDLGKLKL
jgi:hypothetical protein